MNAKNKWLVIGDDGRARCWWPGQDGEYRRYHDEEWGRPTTDDIRLFEKICLEGFQSGLSWITILRKRENFRKAFAGFDMDQVSVFTENDVERLLDNAGVIRHRGKIEATINNAARALEVIDEFGSLAAYAWGFEPDGPEGDNLEGLPVPGFTPTSTRLSKDLKKRGWKFFGPTTAYAFMQAMGLINDHVEGCEWRPICATERQKLKVPAPKPASASGEA